MKVAIENLLRVKGAQLCTEEVDPADIDAAIEEKREPKKRRVCIARDSRSRCSSKTVTRRMS